jgi:GNAT superfamily N-acetyltransferase
LNIICDNTRLDPTNTLAEAPERIIEGMGLAPMAVLPDYQRQGIGSRLIEKGLEILYEQGCPFVIILRHQDKRVVPIFVRSNCS